MGGESPVTRSVRLDRPGSARRKGRSVRPPASCRHAGERHRIVRRHLGYSNDSPITRRLGSHRGQLDRSIPDLFARPGGGPALPRHGRPGVLSTPRGIEMRWSWPDVRFAEKWSRHRPRRRPLRAPLWPHGKRAPTRKAGGRVLLHADPTWDGCRSRSLGRDRSGYRIDSATPLRFGHSFDSEVGRCRLHRFHLTFFLPLSLYGRG